ncbi:MAG: hypothetical protein FWE03_01045 [Firmicutes bacterium]|nr:hypothetical protein [Bacillota bacterium]
MGWNFKNAQIKLKRDGLIGEGDIILKGRHIRSKWWTFPGFAVLKENGFIFVYTHMEDWAEIEEGDIENLVLTPKGKKVFIEFIWLFRGREKVKFGLKLGDNDLSSIANKFESFNKKLNNYSLRSNIS